MLLPFGNCVRLMLLPYWDDLFGWCCSQWLMLLPQWMLFMFGWCYCQGGWWKAHPWVWYGRCYSQSGRMEWPLGQCFNFNSDVLCRTSSHIWGRWYLPIFLFRDGSLTLMNRASLIALVRFWSSLPTMVNLLMLILWPEVLQWSNIGEGAFWCSLNLSAKVRY